MLTGNTVASLLPWGVGLGRVAMCRPFWPLAAGEELLAGLLDSLGDGGGLCFWVWLLTTCRGDWPAFTGCLLGNVWTISGLTNEWGFVVKTGDSDRVGGSFFDLFSVTSWDIECSSEYVFWCCVVCMLFSFCSVWICSDLAVTNNLLSSLDECFLAGLWFVTKECGSLVKTDSSFAWDSVTSCHVLGQIWPLTQFYFANFSLIDHLVTLLKGFALSSDLCEWTLLDIRRTFSLNCKRENSQKKVR